MIPDVFFETIGVIERISLTFSLERKEFNAFSNSWGSFSVKIFAFIFFYFLMWVKNILIFTYKIKPFKKIISWYCYFISVYSRKWKSDFYFFYVDDYLHQVQKHKNQKAWAWKECVSEIFLWSMSFYLYNWWEKRDL